MKKHIVSMMLAATLLAVNPFFYSMAADQSTQKGKVAQSKEALGDNLQIPGGNWQLPDDMDGWDFSGDNWNIGGDDWQFPGGGSQLPEPTPGADGKIDIADCTVRMMQSSVTYDGKEQKPSIIVLKGMSMLSSGKDYTVAYADNIDAGTATATVTGIGKYSGTKKLQFTIRKAEQSLNASVTPSAVMVGEKAEIKVSAKGTVTYSSSNPSIATVDDNGVVTGIALGIAYITISAAGDSNYQSSDRVLEVSVIGSRMEDFDITLSQTEYVYDGSTKNPDVTVSKGSKVLAAQKDYTVSYQKNTNAGTATVTVTGRGSYTGSQKVDFIIRKADQNLKAELSASAIRVGGTAKISASGAVGITYRSGNAEVASVSANGMVTGISSGKAVIYVTSEGDNNHNPVSVELELIVGEPDSVADSTVSLSESEFTYTGTAFEPDVTVSLDGEQLTKGKDYTVIYKNNVNAGAAAAVITGINDYSGTKEVPFTILKADQKVTAALSQPAIMTGQTAQITAEGIGVITYGSTDKKVAKVDTKGKVTAVGAGTVILKVKAAGDENHKEKIVKVELKVVNDFTLCKLKLSSTTYTFTGNAKKPSVTVTYEGNVLKKNTDYKVSYQNNTKAGTAIAVVTGIGDYYGTVNKKFTIKKADNKITADSKITKTTASSQIAFTLKVSLKANAAVTFSSSSSKVAIHKTSGKVTIPANFIGTATITVKSAATANYNEASKKIKIIVGPKKVAPTAKSTVSRKITVTWSKVSNITGYELQISTASSFGNGAVTATFTYAAQQNSRTINNFTSGKTYYLRMRTYKTVSGSKIYSGWSSVKAIKVK